MATVPSQAKMNNLCPGCAGLGDQIAALTNCVIDIRAKYEAHRVNTAGGIHGAADNTDACSVAAPTAVNA